MASENETVAEVLREMRKRALVALRMGSSAKGENAMVHHYDVGVMVNDIADRIESAWRRETEHQAVHNCEIRAKSGTCGLTDEIKAHQREVAKLREFAEFVEELYCGCTCKTTNEEREDGCCNQCEFGEKLRKALQGGEK